jgi:hypothetical protein
VQIRGIAMIGPLGDRLHTWLPGVVASAAEAHWSVVRVVVEPGSPVLGRLVAAGFAHAAVLAAGLYLVRRGARRRTSWLVLAGIGIQVQIAVGILGSQPSIRELEATGVSFAINALLPGLAPRSTALGDESLQFWPPLVAAALVLLALLLGYLPAALLLLLRQRARRITFGTAAVVMLGSAACAGALRVDTTPSASSAIGPVFVSQPELAPAKLTAASSDAPRDNWPTAPVTLPPWGVKLYGPDTTSAGRADGLSQRTTGRPVVTNQLAFVAFHQYSQYSADPSVSRVSNYVHTRQPDFGRFRNIRRFSSGISTRDRRQSARFTSRCKWRTRSRPITGTVPTPRSTGTPLITCSADTTLLHGGDCYAGQARTLLGSGITGCSRSCPIFNRALRCSKRNV